MDTREPVSLIKPEPFRTRNENRRTLSVIFQNELRPLVNKENPRVVSVGCGFGYDAAPIINLYPGAHYLGIDIDSAFINGAQKSNMDIEGDISFEARDARNRESFGQDPLDLVIFRHPQMMGSRYEDAGSREDWERIVSNAVDALDHGGILFASLLSPDERELFLKATQDRIKVITAISDKHRYGGILTQDNEIVIGKKK